MIQQPELTNVIPNYYNRLSPWLNKTSFNNKINYKNPDTLYDVNDDLDNVYSNLNNSFAEAESQTPPNEIFRKNRFDRSIPLLDDIYKKDHKPYQETTYRDYDREGNIKRKKKTYSF